MYGIYIHIPFCVRKCPYCDFYSVAVKDDIRTRFLKALKNEIRSFEPVEADTVYFGGGTPSLLKPSEMSDILDLLHQHADGEPDGVGVRRSQPYADPRKKLFPV